LRLVGQNKARRTLQFQGDRAALQWAREGTTRQIELVMQTINSVGEDTGYVITVPEKNSFCVNQLHFRNMKIMTVYNNTFCFATIDKVFIK
jgi:hypothetical protein